MTEGRVLYGINNLFTVQTAQGICEARIKGKYLKGITDEYNALCCGDRVEIDDNSQITQRLERKNVFSRFNWKQNRPQAIAANLDCVLCVVAADSPPLHPRFLDRLLIACASGGITAWIILTKSDLLSDKKQHPLHYYEKMGYRVLHTSALEKESITPLRQENKGKIVALTGASGVGKSTLINLLRGTDEQKTGEVNRKFNRGNHITNYARMLSRDEGGYWVDTPGVRDLSPVLCGPLDSYYPDFSPHIPHCEFAHCRHEEESGCAVRQGVQNGQISQDRYQNYCKLLQEETLKTKNSCRYKR